ncbi:MAG: hypothetical protein QM750_21900 [Rubrivivax sp.]
MADAIAGTRWRVRAAVELHWRDWGADSVVFEARSGQILQLDPLTAAVIGGIEEQAIGTDDLAAGLAADLGEADPAAMCPVVTRVIEQFERLGWLEAQAEPAAAA